MPNVAAHVASHRPRRAVVLRSGDMAPPLPHNLTAERSLLGALLLDSPGARDTLDRLSPSDFFLPQHAAICRRLKEQVNGGARPDLVALVDALGAHGELEKIPGGAGYVSALYDGMPRVTNPEEHARIVKEKALLRSLIHQAHAIEHQAFDAQDDPHVILARALSVLSGLSTKGTSEAPGWREMFHRFADFEDAAALTFAIKEFLQNNGATLIGGLSGHGKTLILLSIAKALLAGKGTMLWNYFPVEETALRVIYLIPESTIEPFKHRLRLFRLYPYLAPNDERLLVRTLSMGPTPCLSDSRVLFAAKGAHVILDTAVRFSMDADENSASDNQRGLAADIFALLGAGARTVIGAHHSPKPFARENVMRLEKVLRGSGDIGAMVTTAWGVKQLDAARNMIHIENVKSRDFQPPGPFQIIGRPHIDSEGDFRMHKRPGECGSLMEEQEPDRKGGAPIEERQERARRIAMVKDWLAEDSGQTAEQLRARFEQAGVKVGVSAVKHYRTEAETA